MALRRESPTASAETWRSLDDEGLYATRGWLGDSTSMMAGSPEGAGREAGRVRAGEEGGGTGRGPVMGLRFNNRENPYMFRDAMLKLIVAETLPYAKLIADS